MVEERIMATCTAKRTDGTVLGEITDLEYTQTREATPIYIMGSQEPHSFARGTTNINGKFRFTNHSRFISNITPADRATPTEDQIPPFNIDVEEDGTILRISGVEILNRGQYADGEHNFIGRHIYEVEQETFKPILDTTPSGVNIHEVI